MDVGLFGMIIGRFTSENTIQINNTTEINNSKSIIDYTKGMLYRNFVALDVVTTGACPEVDRIIEIAAVKMCGRVLIDRFSTVINPGINISSKISWLTGINNEQVISAPTIGQVFPGLIDFIKDYPVIVQEASPGMRLLENRILSAGARLSEEFHDILALSRIYLRDVTVRGYSYTVPELVEYIGHNNKGKNGAFEKAVTVAAIYNKIMEVSSDKVILCENNKLNTGNI
jgi:DNA polymerase III epsilon subunit-like protein